MGFCASLGFTATPGLAGTAGLPTPSRPPLLPRGKSGLAAISGFVPAPTPSSLVARVFVSKSAIFEAKPLVDMGSLYFSPLPAPDGRAKGEGWKTWNVNWHK